MNKKIIWIIVAVVIVALAAYFLLKGKGSQNNNNVASDTTNASSQANANVSASEQTSLKALLASGKSQKCTFEETTAAGKSQGTVYVASGKMRGDFSATVEGKAQTSHMIVDNQTSYIWVDGMNTGFKMKTDASAQANANANTQAESVDPNKNMSFHCGNSSADASMFDLPANIQFSDMTSLTAPATNLNAAAGAGAGADAAAACAKLSEPAKTQCLAALSAH